MPPSVEPQKKVFVGIKYINKSGIQIVMNDETNPSLPENNSQTELVQQNGSNHTGSQKTIRTLSIQEWVSVSILCFVNLINYMDRYTVAGVLGDIQKYYTIGNDRGGLLQTAFIISYMIFAPIFGYLGDRYNRKIIMSFGVFLWSLTTLLGSFQTNYWGFLVFRGMVGIGEASYSTIAPTIISDLFIDDVRSKILALFYFAIPVGSGLGYIVGSETAKMFGEWQYALRVTPILGLLAVILLLLALKEPVRGHSEGTDHLELTSWRKDVKELVKNPSFMLSTLGFTCVAFVAGALSWWGPKFIVMGLRLQPSGADTDEVNVAFTFGIVSMVSGIVGVPAGSMLAQSLRHRYADCDAKICAYALLVSCPCVYGACLMARHSQILCMTFVFFGELFLNFTWSLVADILLYVVLPTRRSTAEGFQLLVSHTFGDAGSPFLIGLLSEWYNSILTSSVSDHTTSSNELPVLNFRSLQYALLTTCFVEVLGGVFFLINAIYVVRDKEKVEKAIRGGNNGHRLLVEQPEHD